MSVYTDAQDTAKATYDSANSYRMYAYRALMLVLREINTIRTNVVLGLSSISEATWISNVKTKVDAELEP